MSSTTGPPLPDPARCTRPAQENSPRSRDYARSSVVSDFNEAEVRSFVIDPLVKLLGYSKGSIFSVDLEKQIAFIDVNKFIDYSFTLWTEDFWVIEAKRPRSGEHFEYKDLRQALEYATHPEVNAALVVLCDGNKLEIFDRDTSIQSPILSIVRSELLERFDQIRALLGPWQVWFFQKRRILRLLDKVFDREFNLARVDEFKSLIERRLDSKRHIVLENFRSQIDSNESADKLEKIFESAPAIELVDVCFFFTYSVSATSKLIDTLIMRSTKRGRDEFFTIDRIFPNEPKSVNENYFMNALWFLMALHAKRASISYLPSWLSYSRTDLDGAIQKLISLCLSSFDSDPARKTILLAATANRRTLKLVNILDEQLNRAGVISHAIERHSAPELSWAQIVTSPSRHTLQSIDSSSIAATNLFVKECSGIHGKFYLEIAKTKLRSNWLEEIKMLADNPNYLKLRGERDLGELFPTEACNVVYDYLGHCCLCAIERFPVWKQYTIQKHNKEINMLAMLGSWQAKTWLGIDLMEEIPKAEDKLVADRFFFGELNIFESLSRGYGYK